MLWNIKEKDTYLMNDNQYVAELSGWRVQLVSLPGLYSHKQTTNSCIYTYVPTRKVWFQFSVSLSAPPTCVDVATDFKYDHQSTDVEDNTRHSQ